MVLLEAWKAFEVEHGDEGRVQDVQEKMPRVLKKRREIPGGDGAMEEVRFLTHTQYYDMVFPDEEAKNKPAMKLLQMAHAWRAQQAS